MSVGYEDRHSGGVLSCSPTRPISFKGKYQFVAPGKTTSTALSSLSSSLDHQHGMASPGPVFQFLEEDEPSKEFFFERLRSSLDSLKIRQHANSNQKNQQSPALQQSSQQSQQQLFKEYREVAGSSSASFNSDLEYSSGDDSEDYSDSDFDDECDNSASWSFEDYFMGLPGNDWCARIPLSFLQDEFNLFELPDVFRCPLRFTDYPDDPDKVYTDQYGFDDLLDLITLTDMEGPPDSLPAGMMNDAVLLYKLIHQRYIFSKQGIQDMVDKFENHAFGSCPRYLCKNRALLPFGPSALPATAHCHVYCLNCQDVYVPASRIHAQSDGVSFGPSFAHFFVRTHLFGNEEKARAQRQQRTWSTYTPRIYGFKIYHPPTEVHSEIRSQQPTDFK